MRAIFIAVGSELLDLDRIDTNSILAARMLRERGVLLDMKLVVGDTLDHIAWAIKKACQRAQVVIVSGGLGPTDDDLTREAVSTALGRELVYREETTERIRQVFRQRGIPMPDINQRQAFFIDGAEELENKVGTAPGQFIDLEHCKLFLLPGPPVELEPMLTAAIEKYVAPEAHFFIYQRRFKLAGITESEADARMAPLYRRYRNPQTTILAAPGGIELHLLGRSKNTVDEAKQLTDELADKIAAEMAGYIFTQGDETLEQVVMRELLAQGRTVAVAESCTGGLLGGRLTAVPGSSQGFLGGVIAYADEVKRDVLGVPAELLEKHGAVSAQVAKAMAHGVRRLTGAGIGVAITGVAGPGGGTSDKPVGRVYFHLSDGDREVPFSVLLGGTRELIRARTVTSALDQLRRFLAVPLEPSHS